MEYRESGVDRSGGYEIVERIRGAAEGTYNSHVLEGVGGFASLYRLGGYLDPVLVSGTDGVGTKLHLAAEYDALEGVGRDCVAMCVNDVLCHGAKPLFFLDYLAYADLSPERAARIVKGVSAGCGDAGCALVGGESAQMPGTYRSGDFDIAGFVVAAVERASLVDGSRVRGGDLLVGLDSSGLHSNGFSLVRAVLSKNGIDPKRRYDGLGNEPLWRVLLEPTQIYVGSVLPLAERGLIHGMAHITGGGLYENVPRMFGGMGGGDGESVLTAVVESARIRIPAVFGFLESLGIERDEMFHTFNMGVGFVLAVAPDVSKGVIDALEAEGLGAKIIGRVEENRVEEGRGKKESGGVCIE